MGDAFWLRGATEAESVDVKRRATRVHIKETLQAAVRSVVRQSAQLEEAVTQPFPLWPGPLCDALNHGLRGGKDLFTLLISRHPELLPPKPTSSTVTAARVGPIVAAALKMPVPKALPAALQGSLIEDTSAMVDKNVIRGDIAGAFLAQARRVMPMLNTSDSKCLALIAIALNLSYLSALLMPVFGSEVVRSTFYEDWAFMRDSDDVVLLAAMLHTLDPINFAISPAPDRIALYLAPPTESHSPPSSGTEAAPTAPRRKAKKKIATITDLDADARRQREEEEKEQREAQEREELLRGEAARSALLETARREEVRKNAELRTKEEAERAKRESERLQREQEERAAREMELKREEEQRRREEEEKRLNTEAELRRVLAEQIRRNDELVQERTLRLATEEKKRVEDEANRSMELARKAAEERARVAQWMAYEDDARAKREAETAVTAAAVINRQASSDRADAQSAQAQASSGDERGSRSDEAESLAAIKAARVEAMHRRIADDIAQRMRNEGVRGSNSASVAALIFKSAPPLVVPGSPVSSARDPTATTTPISIALSPPSASSSLTNDLQRKIDEEEEMVALRKTADLQREREEKQRNELLLKKRLERERIEEERKKEEQRIRDEVVKRVDEEKRQRVLAEQTEREELQRRRDEELREKEREFAMREAERSEEVKRELQRQEDLRRARAERERLEAIRVQREQQQAAAALAAVRAEEENKAYAKEREDEARKLKEKEDAKRSTEAGRTEALRTLLADMLAPKRPNGISPSSSSNSISITAPSASATSFFPNQMSSSPSSLGTSISSPLSLSETSLPSISGLLAPTSRSAAVTVPVAPPPMSADLPALPAASPSPPIGRNSVLSLPTIPSASSALAPAAQITANSDSFSFFEESDSGAESVPELRGSWRTVQGTYDSSDLFASTALAAAPLLRKLDRAAAVTSTSAGPAPAVRGLSPRSVRSTSPQTSPRNDRPAPFVWTPPRKQLYFRLESQRPATEQGNVCAACGKPLPSRPQHCEYTNKWFCNQCPVLNAPDTGAKHAIPARVLHYWDLRPYLVSEFAVNFLQSISAEAVMDVGAVNPGLYEIAPQLSLVKAFRRKLGWMKNYVLACREQATLMRPFLRTARSHLLYSAEMYALRDFLDLQAGTLLPFIEEQYQAWLQHFPRCELCRARAIVCELCRGANGLFFPWERRVARCPRCNSFFHRTCTATRRGCPRCARDRAKRQLLVASTKGSSGMW